LRRLLRRCGLGGPLTTEPSIPEEERRAELLGFDTLGRLLFGAAAFQTLRAACETGLLDALSEKGLDRAELTGRIGIRGRWLDTLLTAASAAGLVVRDQTGRYAVNEALRPAMRGGEWELFKATVAFEHYITYRGIEMFTESLVNQTNAGIERFPGRAGDSLYVRLTGDLRLREVFYTYMRAWSRIGGPVLWKALAELSPRRLLDIGGGDGVHAIASLNRIPGLSATIVDLAEAVDVSRSRIAKEGLADRIEVIGADMFADEFPPGHDVVLFAHQLVIWTEGENEVLLRKANRALPMGGHVVIFSSMTDDTEDGPFIAAMASTYHTAIPVEGGRIYPWGYYERWLANAGFGDFRRIRSDSWTPHGVIVATKVVEANPVCPSA
jgi:ubiquinone/menaquinone biosynthesis C-methylase UbiE